MNNKKKEASSKNQFVVGIVLIVLGLIILLIQSEAMGWDNFWPLIIICIGLAFFAGYFTDKGKPGLLMPATILTIVGTLFLYLSHTNWDHMQYLWPTFILAPGLGFFLLSFASPENEKFYIPGIILTVIAFAFYIRFWQILELWPYALIGVGLYMIIRYIYNKKSITENDVSD